ncbi:MAG: glycosyltransferase [Bacteroidia bacterium]|nr:glycosyltransferase [Bacteroidia bacterium]
MRIAIIGSAYPFRGGLAAYNERLAVGLQRLGHEVRLYTFTVQYPEWLFPGKTQFRENPPPPQIDIRRRIHSLGPISWWKTGREIRAWRPDLAIAKFWLPVMGMSLGSVLRLLGSETVRLTILDNVIPHEGRLGDQLFTKYFIGSVDGAVAMSRSVAESWQELTRKPVETLFHPVYDHYGEPVSKEEACRVLGLDPAYRYLLFFGLIRAYKGLDLLLEAWRKPSLQKFAEVKLLIAGELYEPYEKYRPLLEAPEVRERVVFHEGFVPDEEVRYYFSVAEAVVQPYRSATQSGVTQIAYHFEKPMIVTNVGGLPEVVFDGEVGYVCEPKAEALAEAIETLLTQPLEKFIQNVRRYRVQFSWETFVKRLLAFSEGLRRGSTR